MFNLKRAERAALPLKSELTEEELNEQPSCLLRRPVQRCRYSGCTGKRPCLHKPKALAGLRSLAEIVIMGERCTVDPR